MNNLFNFVKILSQMNRFCSTFFVFTQIKPISDEFVFYPIISSNHLKVWQNLISKLFKSYVRTEWKESFAVNTNRRLRSLTTKRI